MYCFFGVGWCFFLLLVGSSVLLVWLVVLVYCCWFVALLLLVIGWGLFPERWDSPCPTNKVSVSHNNSNNFFLIFSILDFSLGFGLKKKQVTSQQATRTANLDFWLFFESLFPNKNLDSTDSGCANRHCPPPRHQVTWQYDMIYHPQHCGCIAPKKVKLHFSTQKHGSSDDFIHLFIIWNCQVHLKPRSQQHLPLSLQQGQVNGPRRTTRVNGSQAIWMTAFMPGPCHGTTEHC